MGYRKLELTLLILLHLNPLCFGSADEEVVVLLDLLTLFAGEDELRVQRGDLLLEARNLEKILILKRRTQQQEQNSKSITRVCNV